MGGFTTVIQFHYVKNDITNQPEGATVQRDGVVYRHNQPHWLIEYNEHRDDDMMVDFIYRKGDAFYTKRVCDISHKMNTTYWTWFMHRLNYTWEMAREDESSYGHWLCQLTDQFFEDNKIYLNDLNKPSWFRIIPMSRYIVPYEEGNGLNTYNYYKYIMSSLRSRGLLPDMYDYEYFGEYCKFGQGCFS